MERKMATIRIVDAILPIEGADAIEVAVIGGWKVVVKKGEYHPQDLACYCEIDSFIPSAIAPFLTKEGHHPKTYNGVEGERLRTIKLRGQISQGLLLPMSVVFNKMNAQEALQIIEGQDVSDLLGISKWEPPVEFQAANVKGSFPHFIPKTDQERIQNLKIDLERWNENGEEFQVTEKMDGSSMTVFIKDGEVGVCSRNLELKDDGSSTFWETAKKQGLVDFLLSVYADGAVEIALQGELVGGSIQGNAYKVEGFKFFLYDVFDIKTQQYLIPAATELLAKTNGIQHVPVMGYTNIKGKSIEDLLHDAEGKSQVGTKPEREGLVYKAADGSSFKVISNKWLLKTGG